MQTWAADIVSFSPQGIPLEAVQVHAVFSTAMVPDGRAEAAAAFVVHCPVPGRGRSADERTWIYDLDGPCPAGSHWRLDDQPHAGKGWLPTPRQHRLELVDATGALLDEARFVVR